MDEKAALKRIYKLMIRCPRTEMVRFLCLCDLCYNEDLDQHFYNPYWESDSE